MPKLNIKARHCILTALLLLVFAIKMIPHAGEWYATVLYPHISFVLSAAGSLIPFSVDEVVVVLSVVFIIVFPIISRKRLKAIAIVKREVEFLLWIFVWFYLGWACNYSRDSVYARLNLTPSQYNKTEFLTFLHSYTDSINKYYTHVDSINVPHIQSEIKRLYISLPDDFGLCSPHSFQHPKHLLFNSLYSAVGVKGYMGPFMSESHLNAQLPPYDYPFVYAHELSHLLSISNEAEANFWAFETCVKSSDKSIRSSAYFGILANVARNAASVLSKKEFEDWKQTLNPQILQQAKADYNLWHSLRSPFLDKCQTTLFNWFLKSNNISSGTKNYDQVVNMIISYRNSESTVGKKKLVLAFTLHSSPF